MRITRVRIHAARHGGATGSMESLQSNHTKGTLQQPHTLERRTSSPQTKRRWSGPQIMPRPISKQSFGLHHPSSDLRKRGLEHFQADGTTRGPNRQHLDSGSPGQRSVVSLCLCRATEAKHPFHFKRREPFSRHQRCHHLFRQVLRFSLVWFIKKASPFFFQSSHSHCRVNKTNDDTNKKNGTSEDLVVVFILKKEERKREVATRASRLLQKPQGQGQRMRASQGQTTVSQGQTAPHFLRRLEKKARGHPPLGGRSKVQGQPAQESSKTNHPLTPRQKKQRVARSAEWFQTHTHKKNHHQNVAR